MRFFTITQVADLFGVSSRTVRRWIEQKKLVAHYFGCSVRIAESDLHAFIARHRGA
jgi:excisionase family DNA binding protein